MGRGVLTVGVLGAGVVAALLVVSLGQAGSRGGEVPAEPVTMREPATPPASTSPPPSPDEQARIGGAVEDAVRSVVSGADVGLAVYDRLAGAPVAGVHGERQFYAASVVKLLIAIDLLRDAGWPSDDATRETLASLLATSDDGVADALWRDGGGRSIVSDIGGLIGLRWTTPPNQPREWEMTRTSAVDVVAVYRYIGQDLPTTARDLIVSSLTGPGDAAADGFDQFFGIPAGFPGAEWGVKQGWMRAAGHLVLHTTGLVGEDGRYLVALLTHQPSATAYERGTDAVTAGAAALAGATT
ncbi:hypothetical protein [Amycolatopsis nigrescens]|uniref:hypothetical protein n=1 Tax=Amycolatopsis nigrescens TaxID=381445 RepID=UPI00047654BD|nr:hypothetical protein [Amycolatopsis nigrescens]